MANVVQEVYGAKYEIRKKRSLIFQASYAGQIEQVKKLQREIQEIRNDIIRRHGVIIDTWV